MAPVSTVVVLRPSGETPYQLNRPQVLKASGALVGHIKSESKRKEAASEKKNLLANDEGGDEENTAEPLWLVLTTKKHIVDQKRLKPGKIVLPHTLNKSGSQAICLIAPDPQRAFKDVVSHPAFPSALASQIRVIGLAKVKARYKTFETRRKFLSEFDVFLADDRIVTALPKILGKVFYDGSKRPMPVSLEGPKEKVDGKRVKSQGKEKTPAVKSVLQPALFAKEIEKALSSARVHLAPSVTTSVKVGFSNFSAQEIADNVGAVVDGMVEKFITKGWRNIRSIHIKGPNTVAFPIWMADELWVEQEDVIEDAEAEKAKQIGAQKGTKRKVRELEQAQEEESGEKKPKRIEDEIFNKDMAERRQKLRQANREAREEAENGTVVEITTVVTKKANGTKKVKKTKVIEAAA